MSTYNSTNANGGYIELRSSGTVYGDIGTAAQLVTSGSASDFCLNGRGSRGLVLGTNNASRLYINSSGNVGIGTTSPGYLVTAATSADGVDGVSVESPSVNGVIRLRADGTNGNAIRVGGVGAQANTLRFLVGGDAERARIDTSGRLLVGTSSARSNFFNTTISPLLQIEGASSSSANSGRFISHVFGRNADSEPVFAFGKHRSESIGGTTVVQSGDYLGTVSFQGSDGTEFVEGASISAVVDTTPGANDMPGRLVFSTTADGASSPTERMRISNSGGTNSFVGASNFNVRTSSTSASDGAFIVWNGATNVGDGTNRFVVRADGDCENTNNSYGALSDRKLKENIVDANSQWDDLKALQVRNYNFKEGQTHKQIGLIAQEVELVSPGLVSESPDRDEDGNDLGTTTKSVNYSVLYMKAVKALQEAMERIESLEAKVAALEAS
jgi:hypothetical protein